MCLAFVFWGDLTRMGFSFWGKKQMRENTHSPISCSFPWGCCRQRSSGGWFYNTKQRRCSEREEKSHNDPVKEMGLGLQGLSPKPPSPSGDSKLLWAWSTRSWRTLWAKTLVQNWISTSKAALTHHLTGLLQHSTESNQSSISYRENITIEMSVATPSPGRCCWIFSKHCAWSQALHPPHFSNNSIKWGFGDGDNFTALPWNHEKLNHMAPSKRSAFNGIKYPETLLGEILILF